MPESSVWGRLHYGGAYMPWHLLTTDEKASQCGHMQTLAGRMEVTMVKPQAGKVCKLCKERAINAQV
jgi:hypothetical protein